jgi:hypothetical protein
MPAFDDRVSAKEARELVEYVRDFGPAKVVPAAAAIGEFEQKMQQLRQQWNELDRQAKELSSTPRQP